MRRSEQPQKPLRGCILELFQMGIQPAGIGPHPGYCEDFRGLDSTFQGRHPFGAYCVLEGSNEHFEVCVIFMVFDEKSEAADLARTARARARL